ncbi:hypothetical protein ALT785_60002 [Alteromonas infernus]
MKRISADGSVGFPHVRVGHCQVPLRKTRLTAGFLLSDPIICVLSVFLDILIR